MSDVRIGTNLDGKGFIMSVYDSKTYISDIEKAASATLNREKLFNKKILISGASGLIGSFVVDMLLFLNRERNANIEIYACGRSLERLKKRFDPANGKNLHYVEYDICTEPDFDFDIDYIINAASNAYPAVFANDPVGTITGNIIGTDNLLKYASRHKAQRFLFVSSGEVYGEGEKGMEAYCESYSGYVDPVLSRSCYPVSKRAAETLCVSYTKQFNLDTVIVRPCHTYGPTVTGSDNRANAQFVNSALAGENIIMKSKGLQMRSYCYVADCASALLSVLTSGKTGEAYNIANEAARVTIAQFAREVAELTGKEVIFDLPDENDLAQQTNISYAVLDSKKIQSLGWRALYSVRDGLKSTIDVLSNK